MSATVSPLLKLCELCILVSFQRTKIYALCSDPASDFPRPIKIGRSTRWSRAAVLEWLDKQMGVSHAK